MAITCPFYSNGRARCGLKSEFYNLSAEHIDDFCTSSFTLCYIYKEQEKNKEKNKEKRIANEEMGNRSKNLASRIANAEA